MLKRFCNCGTYNEDIYRMPCKTKPQPWSASEYLPNYPCPWLDDTCKINLCMNCWVWNSSSWVELNYWCANEHWHSKGNWLLRSSRTCGWSEPLPLCCLVMLLVKKFRHDCMEPFFCLKSIEISSEIYLPLCNDIWRLSLLKAMFNIICVCSLTFSVILAC